MKRTIITINEELCDGCGLCVTGCPEGALQMIEGKARLVSDLYCDGLGACIGDCPRGAISTVEREAEAYDEELVMENIISKGPETIRAHFEHLKAHGEHEYLKIAENYLMKKGLPVPDAGADYCGCGCPGSAPVEFPEQQNNCCPGGSAKEAGFSELRAWPVQLHLVNPDASFLNSADLLISADCAPFAYGNFHRQFMRGKTVINLCPKLDAGIEKYIEKLSYIFKNKNISSVTVARMEVPCCGGIERIIESAAEKAGSKIKINTNIISIKGEIL